MSGDILYVPGKTRTRVVCSACRKALRFLFWTAVVLPVLSVATAPSSETDPLLRKPWIDADLASTRGEYHRLSRLLERPGSVFAIKDAAGRSFEVDLRGRVAYSPFDGNWKIVVPRVSDGALHLAEAAALYKRGVRDHATFIWKAVAAMSSIKEPPGSVKANSRAAVAQLNARARRAEFSDYDAQSDPFLFYDDRFDQTYLISHRHRLRMVLPGPWRYQFGETREAKSQWRERVLYLGQQDVVLTLGLDDFQNAGRVRTLGGLIDLWDLRRSLGAQRKALVDFQRDEYRLSEQFCKEGTLDPFRPEGPRSRPRLAAARAGIVGWRQTCGFYRSVVEVLESRPEPREETERLFREGRLDIGRRRNRRTFLEFYHLREDRGLFLEVRFPANQARIAEQILEGLPGNLRLY